MKGDNNMRIIFDENGAYMPSLANNAEKHGIAQYRFPHNYEFVGREFTVTTSLKEYTFKFTDKQFAEVNGEKCDYESEKLEKEMYFVRFGFKAVAFDLMNNQVVIFDNDDLIPGVIKGSGQVMPSFTTDDMVETKVSWVFGCNRYITQEFISNDTVRTSWAPRDEKKADNKYIAIKLRDTFYFVYATSGVLKNTCAPFFTQRVVLLEDYERCMTAGCIMGKGFDPIMVAGYARFED